MNNLAIKYLILYVIVLLSAAYAKADGEKRWVSEINSYVMLYEKCDGKFTLDPSSKSAYFGVKTGDEDRDRLGVDSYTFGRCE